MRRLSLVLGAIGLSLALSVSGCSQKGARASCPSGQMCLEIGNLSDPTSLDPQIVTTVPEDALLRNMFVGLVQVGPAGEALPGVATSWETSANGLVWTFHLRDSVWSDGVPLTANDFVYSLRRIMDPKTASEYASLLYPIKNGELVNTSKAPLEALGVRAIDAHTLEITLEHPAPFLPELAMHTTMMPVPEHVVAKYGDKWSDPEHFVSNGPFRIVSWVPQKNIVAQKNPRYWDASKVCFDRVDFYPTEDRISAERQVQSGELDAQTQILGGRVAFLREPGRMPQYVHAAPGPDVYYLIFNFKSPKFQDVRVRRAMALAIDREFVADAITKGNWKATYNFVPVGMANHVAAAPPAWSKWTLAQRQAEARRLLAEAGYGPGHPLKIEFMSPYIDARSNVTSVMFDLKAIGIEMKVRNSEFQIQTQALHLGDFEFAMAGWFADYNDAMSFLNLLNSTDTMNYGAYKNPAYDAFIDKANHEPDATKRAEYMQQAEAVVLDDIPVIPMYNTSNTSLVNPRVSGWQDSLFDRHPAQYLCFKGPDGKPQRP